MKKELLVTLKGLAKGKGFELKEVIVWEFVDSPLEENYYIKGINQEGKEVYYEASIIGGSYGATFYSGPREIAKRWSLRKISRKDFNYYMVEYVNNGKVSIKEKVSNASL